MLYGLSSAPAVFQWLINIIFQDMLGKFIIAYLDDILIYTLNNSTSIQHMEKVLSWVLKNQHYVKGEMWISWKQNGFPGVNHQTRGNNHGPGNDDSSY